MCDSRPPVDVRHRAVFGTLGRASPWGVLDSGRPGLALVVLSVVEQRLDAVRAVLAGAEVTEVAAAGRGASGDGASVGGPVSDRAARRAGGPVAPAAVVSASGAGARSRSRWRRCAGSIRGGGRGGSGWSCCAGRCRGRTAGVVPAERTIDRILIRQGLLRPGRGSGRGSRSSGSSGRGRCSCGASTSSAGSSWSTPATGELREAKLVTGIDDHSRFCVMAAVVERATGAGGVPGVRPGAGPSWGAGGGDHRQRQAVHRPVRR